MDAIVRRLKDAGFQLIMPLKPIYFDALFIKQSVFSMGWLDDCFLRVRHEYLNRIVRLVKRLVHR